MRSVYERYARMRPEKPRTAEIAVDEMIAICNEIAAWKEKKKSEEANARYNDFLNEKSLRVGHFDKSPYNSIKALKTAWHKALRKILSL